MRLPGAVLLIALGLILLWVASTGKMDRMKDAWDYLSGATDSLPDSSGGVENISNSKTPLLDKVLHTATLHMNSIGDAMTPGPNPTPGGIVS